MVALKDIRASNALLNDATAPQVAVFVGGTAGLGQLTIKALVATGASTKIYLVGRKSAAESMSSFIQEQNNINSKAEIIWVEAEVSLLVESKRVCDFIQSQELRVDLLHLSAGYAPWGERQTTSEGIEIAQSLEYYSRMLFVLQLMPLLEKSGHARVVSVLAGALLSKRGFNIDDVDLEKPGNFSVMSARFQYLTMNTMALDKLAVQHPDVTFLHTHPGLINTGNVKRGYKPNSWVAWFVRLVLNPIIHVFSPNLEDVAQRHLFQATSAAFGGNGVQWSGKRAINTHGQQGAGLFLVNRKQESFEYSETMDFVRGMAQDTFWNHTRKILEPYATQM